MTSKKLNLLQLEDRLTPATFLTGGGQTGLTVKQFNVTALNVPATQTALALSPAITGSFKVAYGDVNGDGTADIITGQVIGTTSTVRVYNGLTGVLMNSFNPFVAGSVSAIYVAAGDMNSDGKAEIAVSNGSVGFGANSDTRIYDGAYVASGAVVVSPATGGSVPAQGRLRDFYAFTNATGSSAGNGTSFTANTGATIAMGDFDGDGKAEIVVGVANGGSARVNIFDAKTLLVTNPLSAYPKPNVDVVVYNVNNTPGVFVAAGDVNGDGRADLVTGTTSGGANIRVFTFAAGSPTASHAKFTNTSLLVTTTVLSGSTPTLAADFLVGSNGAGVRVAARDLNGDGFADIFYSFGANQLAVASTAVGVVDGFSLKSAFTPTPYQLQPTPPVGSNFSLVTAAYPGVAYGAYVA